MRNSKEITTILQLRRKKEQKMTKLHASQFEAEGREGKNRSIYPKRAWKILLFISPLPLDFQVMFVIMWIRLDDRRNSQ